MGANEHAATFHPDYQCELCGDTLTSYRAMLECEARCEAEDRESRRPVRQTVKPASYWVDED